MIFLLSTVGKMHINIVNVVITLFKIVESVSAVELDILYCKPTSKEYLVRQGYTHTFYHGPLPDHTLQGRVYRNITTGSYLTCAGMCLQDDACKSFNFCRDEKRCDMNSAVYSKYMTDLVFSSGCLYFDEVVHKDCPVLRAKGNYEYEFKFSPLNSSDSFRLDFAAKGGSDALLALAEQPNENNYYDIDIGGWGNTKSAIRKVKHGSIHAQASTPGIMHASEYRRFWINFTNWNIQVGRDGERAPFMEWQDLQQRVSVKYIGIASYLSNPVTWIFYSSCDN